MDHDPSTERLQRQYIECGEVAIDIRDFDGLISLAKETHFDTPVKINRFTSQELAMIIGSEFRLMPESNTVPRSIEATLSYLIDRDGSSAEEDLYELYDHLVTRLNYDQNKFGWSPRVDGSHILTYQLDNELVAAITIDDMTDGTTLGDTVPGIVTLRINYESDSLENVGSDLRMSLRLWGDMHDAISYPYRGKHADRIESPVVIEIGPFHATDEMLAVHTILMKYEQDRLESDETWPPLDMTSIDPLRLLDVLEGFDEAKLRAAIATLMAESRVEYGRTGKVAIITGERLVDAITRLGPEF